MTDRKIDFAAFDLAIDALHERLRAAVARGDDAEVSKLNDEKEALVLRYFGVKNSGDMLGIVPPSGSA